MAARLASRLWRRVHGAMAERAVGKRALDAGFARAARIGRGAPDRVEEWPLRATTAAEPALSRPERATSIRSSAKYPLYGARRAKGTRRLICGVTAPRAFPALDRGKPRAAAPPAADDDEPAAAATPNSDLERNASAAAERRRRAAARDAQAAKAAAAAASTSDAASSNSRSGGRLRTSLLFFHGIPEQERARATARLSDLVRDSIAADESHGPILLCGGAVPPSAVSNGFACIRLDASIDDLRDSLEMATFTAGGAAAAELRDNGADLISSTRKLQRVLRCEDVRLMDAFHHHAPRGGSGSGASASAGGGGVLPLGTSEAMRMTKTLLLDGDGLRSALDVPWTGLFLDLLSSGRADSDAEDHGLEFIDARAVAARCACTARRARPKRCRM